MPGQLPGLGGGGLEVLLPEGRGIQGIAAMGRQSLANLTKDGGVDTGPGNNGLTLSEGRQFQEQVPTSCFNSMFKAILIHRIDNAHQELTHTLG